jgi:hypothetical protein
MEEARQREKDLARRRALLKTGALAEKKQTAVDAMANIRAVQKGDRLPPALPTDSQYSEPIYDTSTRRWMSWALFEEGGHDESRWMAWCVNNDRWMSREEWEKGTVDPHLCLEVLLVKGKLVR